MSRDETAHDPAEKPAEDGRGRQAKNPLQISWRGWYDIGRRVAANFQRHNISLIAAGVALFLMLSIFPALNAAVSVYALFSTPEDIINHLEPLRQLLPDEAFETLTEQLTSLASTEGSAINWTLFASLAVWLWVSRKGAKALITACNIVYDEYEHRPFWGLMLVSILFTFIGIVGFLALAVLAILAPLLFGVLPMGDTLKSVLGILRWPLLAMIFILVLQCIYRYAPNRKSAKWRWVSVGAVVATVLWIGASIGFTLYVQNFADYNETYGTIGGVIILILWFYISAIVVLLGAEINAEMEHQTEIDSTVGDDKPMGERGAFVADTVGKEPNKDEVQ